MPPGPAPPARRPSPAPSAPNPAPPAPGDPLGQGARHPPAIDPGTRRPAGSVTRGQPSGFQWVSKPAGSGDQGKPSGSGDQRVRLTQWARKPRFRATQRVFRGVCDRCAFRAGDPPELALFPLGHFFPFSQNPPPEIKGHFVTTRPDMTQRVSKHGKTGITSHKLRKGSKSPQDAFYRFIAPTGLASDRSTLPGTIPAFSKGLP